LLPFEQKKNHRVKKRRHVIMPHTSQVPSEIVLRWQEIVDLLAEIMHVPSALIMRVEPPHIKVFVSSESKGNPYEPNELAPLNTGLYCETVMKTRLPLLVADALRDESWKSNPDIKLGMISYLGVPISWPDGEIFGTICVLDNKSNAYSGLFLRLLSQWRDVLQADLRSIARFDKELAEREAKIRRLVDSNIIGIVIWNLDGQIIDANEAFLRMVGYDREDLVLSRLNWTELTPPEWRERQTKAVAELRSTGTIQPFEKEYFRKDGSRLPVLIGAASFEASENQVVAFVLNLTERKRAEAEARESERRYREMEIVLAHANRVATLGQLTASIVHEVNQPIAATITNAETALRGLAKQSPDWEKTRQAIERVLRDGRRAATIVDGIRNLVKKVPTRKNTFEVNDAILEVIALTRAEMLKNGVSHRVQLATTLPRTLGDRVQLQQVILNLILNAVEAMSEARDGPRDLLICTEAEANRLRVAVQDSGPGLSQAGAERAFEAFYTTKPSGLGMGLSICRTIVEAHGGQLWTTPNHPRGAIFYFTLPAITEEVPNP
jgi:PAS domain S-box-containing protein